MTSEQRAQIFHTDGVWNISGPSSDVISRGGEIFSGVAKCRLFSQATKSQEHFICSIALQHYFTQITCAKNDCKRLFTGGSIAKNY